MSLLHRHQPELSPEQFAAKEAYDKSLSVVPGLYQASLHERVPKPMTPEQRDATSWGIERPMSRSNLEFTIDDTAFLEAKPDSTNLFERTTGKTLTMHIVDDKNALTGVDTKSHDLALVNLRAAQGRVIFGQLEQAYREQGIAWEFAGAKRMIAIYGYNSDTRKYGFLRCLSDLHPASEVDLYVKQSPTNPTELDYSVGVPYDPVVSDEILFQTTGERRCYDEQTGVQIESEFFVNYPGFTKIYTKEQFENLPPHVLKHRRLMTPEALMNGLRVKSILLEYSRKSGEEVTKVAHLPEEIQNMISEEEAKCLDFIADLGESGMSSFVYRLANYHARQIRLAKNQGLVPEDYDEGSSLFSEGVLTDEYKKKFGDELVQMACYEIVVRRMQAESSEDGAPYNGVFGSIGLLDVNDPSMDHITMAIASEMGLDLNDPNKRNILQGTIYVSNKMNGVLDNGMVHRVPGEPDVKVGIIQPFFNMPSAYANYRGFNFLENAIKEIDEGTNGRPMMLPGWLSNIVLPSSRTEAGATFNVISVIDLMEAPGYLMEQVAMQSNDMLRPWIDEETVANYNATIDRVLSGDYVDATVGTHAERVSNIGHVLLRLSGDVTDQEGITKYMMPEGVLEVQGALQVASKIGELAATTSGETALVPYMGEAPHEVRTGHAFPMREKKKVFTLDKAKRGTVVERVVKQKKFDKLRDQGKDVSKGIILKALLPDIAPNETESLVIVSDGRTLHYSYNSQQEAARRAARLKKETGQDFDIPYADVRVMGRGNRER